MSCWSGFLLLVLGGCASEGRLQQQEPSVVPREPLEQVETQVEVGADVDADADADQREASPGSREGTAELDEPAPTPRSLGTMWNTFYILANEDSYIGPATTMLYDRDCRPITKVRLAFYNSLCIQGSGVLSDKTVVNFDKSCTRSCPRARKCRIHPVRICYKVLDPEVYPWGMGKAPRPLVPDWSVAVDPDFVPLDTVLYIKALDGVVPPGKSSPHDGCFAAVDTGGGIDDNHIDIFAGTRERWQAWEKILPTRSRFEVFVDHPRCLRHSRREDISQPAKQ